MRINLKKPSAEVEKYKIEKESILTMSENELDVYIDHNITDIESIKEYLKKLTKLARYKK